MIYLQMFWEFFKVGLFAVGGGMSTLPFLYDLGSRTGWFTSAQLADMLAISECTPGPIGVNMATFAGYTSAGLPGAVIATLGLIAPSIAVILIIARFLQQFRTNRWVDAAFSGLRPASTAMVAGVGLTMLGQTALSAEAGADAGALNWGGIALVAVLLALMQWAKPVKNAHPIVCILFSAAAGVLLSL